MPPVDRFTVSLDTELLAAFDGHIAARGYQNRSEAVRDMIRDLLLGTRVRQGQERVVAFLTLVCDHRVGEAAKRMRACLVENTALLCGTLQVPLDGNRDGVTIALQGPSDRVHAVADELQALRGVRYGRLSAIPLAE